MTSQLVVLSLGEPHLSLDQRLSLMEEPLSPPPRASLVARAVLPLVG